MKLEITLCHSILENCFINSDINKIDSQSLNLWLEIKKRKIIYSKELENCYFSYFENNKRELLDHYRNFVSCSLQSAEQAKFIKIDRCCNKLDTINNDNYFKTLINTANNSIDKIVFSNKFAEYKSDLYNFKIDLYDKNRINNIDENNPLNQYRLPIKGKIVNNNESSEALSLWLSKFFETENNIIIIDNYIYDSIENFKKYILKFIKPKSSIKIYTLVRLRDHVTDDILKKAFSNKFFSQWNVELFVVKNKKVSHARNIYTNQYNISIDTGISVFGTCGKTRQSEIRINYKENTFIPVATKLI